VRFWDSTTFSLLQTFDFTGLMLPGFHVEAVTFAPNGDGYVVNVGSQVLKYDNTNTITSSFSLNAPINDAVFNM
jgi:hypothetical protein